MYCCAGPAVDRRRRRQLALVDVDHGRIGRGQLVLVRQRLAVDLLRNRQPVAARLRQPDQLFQPCRARRLQVTPALNFFAPSWIAL